MSVIIGVDPHKATHTAVAIDRTEAELARARVRASRTQVPQLLRWPSHSGNVCGRSSPLAGWAICWRSSSWPPVRPSSTCRRRWRRGFQKLTGVWPGD
jgi:hypothetical protein